MYPTTFSASAFLIALAVWFPTTVLTSSGIQNVEKSYFEVASILGAGTGRQILRVAIPGAMPSMFIGFFNGTYTAFLALMSAEMLGVKFSLGWYINWKWEVMEYANVYVGLILIAIIMVFYGKLVIEDDDGSWREVPGSDEGAKGFLQSCLYRRQLAFSMAVDYKHKTHVEPK